MPQSLSDVNLHIIFSTKDRYPFIDKEIRDRLHGSLKEVESRLQRWKNSCIESKGVALGYFESGLWPYLYNEE